MDKKTEALKIAMEALESCWKVGLADNNWKLVEIGIAIREALAEQPAQQQEPVAYITPLMEQQMFDDWCPYKGNPDPRTVWAAAIEAVNGLLLGASPQPAQQQEPVAVVADHPERIDWLRDEPPDGTLLYTSPPASKPLPLTDEQQIAKALRVQGLTLVKTASGYEVLKLGQITAHGIKE